MCGIAGLVDFGAPVPEGVVARMNDALAHRGPDGEGLVRVRGAEFGHRRLAIRDLSEAGRQPLFDESGEILVVFNGEIYNDLELRTEIEKTCGYRFRSTCDAEVVPIGWRLWGEGLFERLEGMFAIAIRDLRDDTLILARDPVGIKPLFYAQRAGRILFASEVKGLLASGLVSSSTDPRCLHAYLASGYVDPDRSLVAEVKQVPPGCVLVARSGTIDLRRHWRPHRRGAITDHAEALQRLGPVLEKSCERLLLSDVPVGLLLSSGIDSIVIASLLRGRSVPAFTARFTDQSFDEGAGARAIAEANGHEWHAVDADDRNSVEADFRAVALAVDGELADSSALAHYALSRAISRKVKVALAGDGADEFFGGYPTYLATRIATAIGGVTPSAAALFAARLAAKAAARREERLPLVAVLSRFLAGLASPGPKHPQWRRLTPSWVLTSLYGAEMAEAAEDDPLAAYGRAFAEAEGATLLDRGLLADQTYYLPGDLLAKVDRMSMAHGLEIRVPFLEREVMDLAGELHGTLLAPVGGPTKKVLRDFAAARGTPAAFVGMKKRGFNVPVAALLRKELARLGDRLLDSDADILAPHLTPDGVRRLWRAHRAREEDNGYALWALLVHAVWREANPAP